MRLKAGKALSKNSKNKKITGIDIERPRGLTPSGEKIFCFMKEMKIKGNFRDFVLFVGPKMHDSSGEFDVFRPDMEQGQKAYVALLHKRDLHEVIGEKEAEKFWSKKLKKRNNSLAHSPGWSEHGRRASLGLNPSSMNVLNSSPTAIE